VHVRLRMRVSVRRAFLHAFCIVQSMHLAHCCVESIATHSPLGLEKCTTSLLSLKMFTSSMPGMVFTPRRFSVFWSLLSSVDVVLWTAFFFLCVWGERGRGCVRVCVSARGGWFSSVGGATCCCSAAAGAATPSPPPPPLAVVAHCVTCVSSADDWDPVLAVPAGKG
jgi:hypothetical protein